jgi:diguanylate cyclase (GGDEF)-like protein
MTDLAGCKVFAERLRRRVEEMETVIDDIPITITISIGLTTYEPSMQGIDKSQMMRVADSALYQAKHKGRNRLVVGMLPV